MFFDYTVEPKSLQFAVYYFCHAVADFSRWSNPRCLNRVSIKWPLPFYWAFVYVFVLPLYCSYDSLFFLFHFFPPLSAKISYIYRFIIITRYPPSSAEMKGLLWCSHNERIWKNHFMTLTHIILQFLKQIKLCSKIILFSFN